MGSNPTPRINYCIHYTSKEDIINFLPYLKRQGYRESTLEGYSKIFRHLAKFCDINDPEDVKDFIARKKVSEGRKELLVNCYARYCQGRVSK